MKELNDNVFIKKWFLHIDKYIDLYKEYYIYYIDGSKRRVVFTKESTDEEIKPQLLHLVNRDLKEKGWVKEELTEQLTDYIYNDSEIQSVLRHSVNSDPEYNPADDPYYKNENLYVP